MKYCNGCKFLDKQYEFSQNGLVCHYHYSCINPAIVFKTSIEKWSQDKDVMRPAWCDKIAFFDEKDRPKDDQRTRRRICLRP